MLALFYVCIILSVIAATLAISLLIVAMAMRKVLKANYLMIRQSSGPIVVDLLCEASVVLKWLFKIKPLRKKAEDMIGKQLIRQLRGTILKNFILSLALIALSLILVGKGLSYYSMHLTMNVVSGYESMSNVTPTPSAEIMVNTSVVKPIITPSVTPDKELSYIGSASGVCAVDLGDGKYYWFHQGGTESDKCKACGTWTSATWGSIDSPHTLGVDGGAMYTLAIIASNLLGKQINPLTIAEEVFGCEIKEINGTTHIDTSKSECISHSFNSVDEEKASISMSQKYNLMYEIMNYNVTTENYEIYRFLDTYLTDNYLIWVRVKPNCPWNSTEVTQNVILRKLHDDNYYCLVTMNGKDNSSNNANGATATMKIPIKKTEFIQYIVPFSSMIAFKNPNVNSTLGHNEIMETYNNEMYKILIEYPKYKAQALCMTRAYEVAAPLYGENFAIGLMANILSEGKYGKIEGLNYEFEYWYKASPEVIALAGKVIDSPVMVDILLEGIPDGTPGIGVGMIQWSGGRRIGILKKYKARAITYSVEELGAIEVEYMLDELGGSYKSRVVDACEGKNAAECADIICRYYEVPRYTDLRAVERAQKARDLVDVLGIGTY